MTIYYACACNQLFKDRAKFVRHRMSARKLTRSIKHKFLGKFFTIEVSQ